MIYLEKLLEMNGSPVPNYASGLYTLMFKSNRIGPPVGTPCFMSPESYEKSIKGKDQFLVTCFFPVFNISGPLSKWIVSEKDVILVEKGSFFERLIMIESNFYSPKKIFSDKTIKDISNTGGLLVDMPATATDKFFDELKELRSEFKFHSMLNVNKNFDYTNEENDLHLVVLVNDVFYSIPTFGRKGKSSLSMLILLIEEQRDAKIGNNLKCVGNLSIVFSNEEKSPFIVDGVDMIIKRNLDNNICEAFKSFCKPKNKYQQTTLKPKLPPSSAFTFRVKKETEVKAAKVFNKDKNKVFKVFYEDEGKDQIQAEIDTIDKLVKQKDKLVKQNEQ